MIYKVLSDLIQESMFLLLSQKKFFELWS